MIKFNKEINIVHIIGWFFTIVAFVWVMAVEVAAAEARMDQVEKQVGDQKVLIEKLVDKTQLHGDSIITLKSRDKSQQEQLKAIKEDTKYLRDKIDKILEKVK